MEDGDNPSTKSIRFHEVLREVKHQHELDTDITNQDKVKVKQFTKAQ